MAAKRKGIRKKDRFEVFKRDNFKCQYCGKAAPDVVLQIDHIKPVSKGGKNDIINLITSCRDCNAGKSDRELDDDAAIQKQRAQLEELSERREQLEMMLQWRDSMKDMTEAEVDSAIEAFEGECNYTVSVNDHGRRKVKALVRKHGLSEVLKAIEIVAERYLKFDEDGDCTNESAGSALNKIGAVIQFRSKPEGVQQIYYCRGIVRNRMYCNDQYCLQLLKEAQQAGVPIDDLMELAKTARNWSEWQMEMHELIEGAEK